MSTKSNAKQLAEAMTIGTPAERRVWFPFRNSENRLAKLIRLVSVIALTKTALNAEANAAELDQMFSSLGPAYTTMEGAKACKLEPQIGAELLAFGAQRVAQLEQTSKLSQAQKNHLRNKAVNEAPMLAAIGACRSVLAAFQIIDVQRRFLEAQQTSKVRVTEEQSASPHAEPQPTAGVGASPQSSPRDDDNLPSDLPFMQRTDDSLSIDVKEITQDRLTKIADLAPDGQSQCIKDNVLEIQDYGSEYIMAIPIERQGVEFIRKDDNTIRIFCGRFSEDTYTYDGELENSTEYQ
ncbi:hypothetical protein GOL91_03560 [Sinorhizobium medicae]|nr:hypothetical protein [Sinorhizobium medicae]